MKLIDVSRFINLCKRLKVTPQELLMLVIFYMKDQANLYRAAFEVPFELGASPGSGIKSEVLESLEQKGYLIAVHGWTVDQPLTDKYDVVCEDLDILFLDSIQATEELYYAYPSRMTAANGQEFTTRNISLDELHDKYVTVIGYKSRTASRSYVSTKGIRSRTKPSPEVNLLLVDKFTHEKVMASLKTYLEKVKANIINPMGIEKFLAAQMWEDEEPTSQLRKESNFTEGF